MFKWGKLFKDGQQKHFGTYQVEAFNRHLYLCQKCVDISEEYFKADKVMLDSCTGRQSTRIK
jgi:hypothetical protein